MHCLQVTYDISRPPNSRVVSVQVQCAACRVPTYSKLQPNLTYNILINDFIGKGGDGFHMLESVEKTPLSMFYIILYCITFAPFIFHNLILHLCHRISIEHLSQLNLILIGITLADVLERYIEKHSPVYPGVSWRISYVNNNSYYDDKNKNDNNLGTTYRPIAMTILLPIITLLLIA